MEKLITTIEGCKKQDPKSQKKLYEQYYAFALKIVFRYIYRYETAVDVTNNGFVKLFTGFYKFEYVNEELDATKMLMGYIKRIMINCAIDQLRKDKMIPQIGGIPEHVWNATNKSENADQSLLYKEIIELIKGLPAQYSIVFNMYVIDGYNHLEIADLLNIAVGTSKSNLSRARVILQNNIKKENESACNI